MNNGQLPNWKFSRFTSQFRKHRLTSAVHVLSRSNLDKQRASIIEKVLATKGEKNPAENELHKTCSLDLQLQHCCFTALLYSRKRDNIG